VEKAEKEKQERLKNAELLRQETEADLKEADHALKKVVALNPVEARFAQFAIQKK